jgi:hypothetical protein
MLLINDVLLLLIDVNILINTGLPVNKPLKNDILY